MKELKDLVVVITGASSGVGKAMALEFASYGTKLILGARRKEALDELVAECKESGSIAQGIFWHRQNDITTCLLLVLEMLTMPPSANSFHVHLTAPFTAAGFAFSRSNSSPALSNAT